MLHPGPTQEPATMPLKRLNEINNWDSSNHVCHIVPLLPHPDFRNLMIFFFNPTRVRICEVNKA